MIDYEKAKSRIERQLRRDYKKYYKLTEKIGDIKCNDIDVRIGTTLGIGALLWAVGMIALPAILNNGIIPLEVIQPLSVGLPIIGGLVAEEGMIKAFKNKERLKKASSAKTQQERIEHATKFEIARERLHSKIKVLEKTYEEIQKKEKIDSELGLQTTKDKSDIRSLDELNKSINSIDDLIYEKLADMDETSAKAVLKKKFWRERDKYQKFFDIPLAGVLGFAAGFIIYNIPLIAAAAAGTPTDLSMLQLFAPGVITGVASTGYFVKRNLDYTRAFKNVNKEILGDNAIPETIDDSKRKRKIANNKTERFDLQLSGQISQAASLATLQEEEKAIKQAKYNTGDDILFEDFEPVKVTEATRQHVLEHPGLYKNCPPRIRQGMFYTDEEYETRFEEVMSKPLPGGEEKGISFVKKNKR